MITPAAAGPGLYTAFMEDHKMTFLLCILFIYLFLFNHKNQITTGAGLLHYNYITTTPARGVFVALCYVITRLKLHICILVAYPYIIPLLYKNVLKRHITTSHGHIQPPDPSRQRTKTRFYCLFGLTRSTGQTY